ncbi:max-binding protein MNT-like [Ptychodera flava]|uniref:max-binding protein MNT-like n=1 Tax=Ptychodera flava TaxID=63121 RepID=UPI003969D772
MSIETLLEAAKFLEWRAQTTQARDEGHTVVVKDDIKQQKNAFPDVTTIELSTDNSDGVLTVSDAYDDRDKRRSGGAGTREVHNKLEKNRRAHLKECFDVLKKQIPNMEDKKTSNLCILRSALRYIQVLKRKEKEYEHEMERLAREKISYQQKLAHLKIEFSDRFDHGMEMPWNIKTSKLEIDEDQASTSTASEGEDEEQSKPNMCLPLVSISGNFPRSSCGTVAMSNRGNYSECTSKPEQRCASLAVVHNNSKATIVTSQQSNLSQHMIVDKVDEVGIQVQPPIISQSVITIPATQRLNAAIPKSSGAHQQHVNIGQPKSFQQLLSAQPVSNSSVNVSRLSVPPPMMTGSSNVGPRMIHSPLITHPTILPIVHTAVTKSLQEPVYSSSMASVFTRPPVPAAIFKPGDAVSSSNHSVNESSVSQSGVSHNTSVKAVPVTLSNDTLKSITVNH